MFFYLHFPSLLLYEWKLQVFPVVTCCICTSLALCQSKGEILITPMLIENLSYANAYNKKYANPKMVARIMNVILVPFPFYINGYTIFHMDFSTKNISYHLYKIPM